MERKKKKTRNALPGLEKEGTNIITQMLKCYGADWEHSQAASHSLTRGSSSLLCL